MWGADTALVIDGLQIAAIATAVGASAVLLIWRWRKAEPKHDDKTPKTATDLEGRVQVLERIATNRSHELAEEIEQLRDKAAVGGNS